MSVNSTVVKLRVDRLKAMHNFMCNANNENLYIQWVELGVPDCPNEDDYTFIAEDEETYEEVCEIFRKIVAKKSWQ